jgi:hypothetical protein
MVESYKNHNLEFKFSSSIYCILEYIDIDALVLMQLVSKRFYNSFIPRAVKFIQTFIVKDFIFLHHKEPSSYYKLVGGDILKWVP